MRTFLVQASLWKYTYESQATFPPRVTQTDVDRINAANAAAQLAGLPLTLVPTVEGEEVYEAR